MKPIASYSIEFTVPRNPDGDITIYFSARDEAGNWFSTDDYTITPVNAAPRWGVIPTWSITEEQEATLDLAQYLSDENDDVTGLTLVCDDDTITVDGLLLKALYDEAIEDWTIGLKISDGEDDLDTEVTVHIVNVNDPPSIVSLSPENGSSFKEGKIITFTVITSDEDGDEIMVTWTSDGVTLGTKTTLGTRDLKPGSQVVKVIISDGLDTTEEEITVVIKKEEESPGLGAVFVLLAMLVGMAAVMMRRKG
jgi:hypothetical protein